MRKLMMVFSLVFIFTSFVTVQADPFSKVQEELNGISNEERETLENLFKLLQEIEIIETEEMAIAQEIEKIDQDIKKLEISITGEEEAFEKKQYGLKKVLKSYQRMGPASYIKIILDSDSLSSFLRRINTLRDLTRDTGKLLEQLKTSREKLLESKAMQIENLKFLESKLKQSREALAKKNQLKEDMESYIASLEGEKKFYKDYLSDMHNAWNELKSVFSDTAKEFSKIIQDGNLPTDAMKLSFSVFGIKGSIDEKTFNDIVSKQTNLEKMIFDFQPDKIEIALSEKSLVISGIFIVLDGHTLKFQAQEGSFYGMPLEPESIEELFRENQLVLDLQPLLSSNTLQSVEIQENRLVLKVELDLF